MRNSLLRIVLLLLVATTAARAQVRIRKISVVGNKVTRERVILRELAIAEGATVSEDSLELLQQQNKLRLFNLQLFNEVEQRIERSGSEADWYITVKERWYFIPTGIVQFADRNINTWWVKEGHDPRRVTAGVMLTDVNFRGNLERLAVTLQEGYTRRAAISYMRPYVNKEQTDGFGFSAGYAENRLAYYATMNDRLAFTGTYEGPAMWREVSGGLDYAYRPRYASRHILHLGYRDIRAGDSIVLLNSDYFKDGSRRARLIELHYRYEYNRVDNWSYPLTGYKVVSDAVVRQGIEGLDWQAYVREEAGAFYNPVGRWYTSVILRGRVMLPQTIPYFFRGGLGMQREQVRGYEYYVADGYHYGILRLNLKREVFNKVFALPVKYLSAAPLRIYPKLFFDAGYITSPVITGGNTLQNTMLYSIGAGVDIVTFYDVKMRVEVARNHLGQNGLYLHFNSE